MSEYLTEFIEFFGLDNLLSADPLTVQQVIGYQITAFIGAIFLLTAVACVFEIIKTVCDWRHFV